MPPVTSPGPPHTPHKTSYFTIFSYSNYRLHLCVCLFVCLCPAKELNMWIWRHNGLTIILWPNCPDWRDLGSHWPLVDGSLDISDAPQTFCPASNRRLIGWNGTVAAVLFSFLIKIIPNVMMVMVMLWECWPPENEDVLLIGPFLILLHHDQSELLFLRKDRYWARLTCIFMYKK